MDDILNALAHEITQQDLGRTTVDGPDRLKIITHDEREFYLFYYRQAGMLQLVCWSPTNKTDFITISTLDIRNPNSIDTILHTLQNFPIPTWRQ